MNRIILFILFSAALAINCSSPKPLTSLKGYTLSNPDSYSVLPDSLHEISGITLLDSNNFACIQDENGILYVYDVVKKNVTSQFTFAPNGDYEAVTKVGSTIYVLRSDGMLFEITEAGNKKMKTTVHYTNIPASNNEGLCFDKANNRLLIGCKSRPGKGPEYKDVRVIYAFDLQTKTTSKKPVFTFSVDHIIRFAEKNNIVIPLKTKGKTVVSSLKLSTSEIAIHPRTKQLYLLSAADHMLLLFDELGNIEHIEKLNPAIFNKPEGVTFFPNGDMLITNEGQNRKPTLLRFNYKES